MSDSEQVYEMSEQIFKLTEQEVAQQCHKAGYTRNEIYRLDRHGCQIQIIKHIIDLLQKQIDELKNSNE